MRRIGEQTPLRLQHVFEARDHVVEGRSKKEQLVAVAEPRPRDVQPPPIVARLGDVSGRFGDAKHGADRGASDQPPDHHRQQEGEKPGRQQQPRHRGHGVLEWRQRLSYLDRADDLARAGHVDWFGQQAHAGVTRRNGQSHEDRSVLVDRLQTVARHR